MSTHDSPTDLATCTPLCLHSGSYPWLPWGMHGCRINLIAECLSLVFSIINYYVCQDFAVAMMIIATVVCYFTVFVFESSKATAQLGLVCNFFTIIFAAPLATMVTTLATHETRIPPLISTLCMAPAVYKEKYTRLSLPSVSLSLPSHTHTQVEVVRNKSTETMSFPLTVMSLLTTASWTTYGTLIHDIYVQVSVTVCVAGPDNLTDQIFNFQGFIYHNFKINVSAFIPFLHCFSFPTSQVFFCLWFNFHYFFCLGELRRRELYLWNHQHEHRQPS